MTASDGAHHDHFGKSVSISGDYAIVGADGHDHAGEWSGVAYMLKVAGRDRFEANDSFETATDIGPVEGLQGWSGLDVHESGNADWYRFELTDAGQEEHFVRILFDHLPGDVEMRLYDAAGDELDIAIGVEDIEQISLDGYSAGTYYLKVYARGYTTSPSYKLVINARRFADAFEPNDSLAAAGDLGQINAEHAWDDLSIHEESNEDWYRFGLAENGMPGHFIALDLSHLRGNVDMALYDAGGGLLQS
ncbi:unnamed protein product, partial [marine sediment metagenome]